MIEKKSIKKEFYMPGAELSWDQIEVTQNAANKQAGRRYVPGRSIPVPASADTWLRRTALEFGI